MNQYDKILEIYNRLKKDLYDLGIRFDNNTAVSNRIIISLSEAMGDGIERGELSGEIKAVEEIENVLVKLKMK